MSDIEGGQAGLPQQHRRTGSAGDLDGSSSRSGSWLGAILHRTQHHEQQQQPAGDQEHSHGHFGRPFRQQHHISTVQEETSLHARPSASGSSGGGYTEPSFAAGLGPRSTGLGRQAEPLQQLYSTSPVLTSPHEQQQQQQQQPGSSEMGKSSSSGLSGVAKSSGSASANGSGNSNPPPRKTGSQAHITALGDMMIGRQSMQVKVSEGATKKYIHMVSDDVLAEQMTAQKHMFARGVIHPLDRRYRAWWFLTVAAAAFTGFLTTYSLAFLDTSYQSKFGPAGILEVLLLCVFCVDIIISFFVGYYDEAGLLVMEHMPVAYNYARRRLWLDILTTLPWEWIALSAAGVSADSTTGRYIALLSLLKLGRMYRVAVLFYNISYNLSVGLTALTLMRNLTFCFYLLHWAACGFWYVALQQGGGANSRTWVAMEAEMLGESSTLELYIFSFYWALVTFATLGYGDVTPNSTPEVLYTIVYVTINIVAWAYVLGTITLLVTKQDEELGVYRQRMQSLIAYCNANNLPKELKQTMAGLLRLHMSLQNEAQGDEQVLGIFPTTIRRKILRQLYSNPLNECYLFKNTGVKFLDALMLGARVELFLPKVEIVSALDHANELYVVVGGYVEVVDPSLLRQNAEAAAAEEEARESQGDENAFTAGMVTGQQLQSSATFHATPHSHSAVASATPGRLMPLIEGTPHQQQPETGNGSAAPGAGPPPRAGIWRRVYSAPDAVAADAAATAAAAAGGGGAGGGGRRVTEAVARLVGKLPGGGKLEEWVRNGRSNSWRKQQEQLQRDKYNIHQIPAKALARASRTLASTSRSLAASGSGGRQNVYANDALKMPAFAMRNLSTTSKLPSLQQASVSLGGSSWGGTIAASAGTASEQGQGQGGGIVPDATGRTELGPGDCFAEVAYFTEVPKAEAVRSMTVCRVLVIPRSTYNAVAQDFPLSARQVLQNLQQRAQELVEEFLPRDLARDLVKGADGAMQDNTRTSGRSTTAAAAAAGSGARGGSSAGMTADQQQQAQAHSLSPFSAMDVQGVADTAAAAATRIQQQQQQQQQGPSGQLQHGASAPASQLDAAASTAAALRRLTPTAMAAAAAAARSSSSSSSIGGSGAASRRERPLLSSMSVNLSGRYSTPGGLPRSPTGQAIGPRSSTDGLHPPAGRIHSRSSEATMFRRASVDLATAAAAGADGAAAGGGGTGSPAFLSRSSSMERRSLEGQQQQQGAGWAGGGAGGQLDGQSARALARFTVQVNPRHRGAVGSAGSAAELGLPAAGGGSGGGLALGPRSSSAQGQGTVPEPLSPRWQQQQQQRRDEDVQRTLRTMSLIPRRPNAEMARVWEGIPKQQQPLSPSEGGTGGGQQQPPLSPRHSGQQQQQQWPPPPVSKLSGLGYEEGSRLYSDEEVQAVAAALPAPLSVQQQRLLADLLRLKRLVNKAAAKFDQMQLTSFLDAAANGDVDVVQDMLRQGMNPNTADYDGRTALMIAAYKGRKDVVLALLFAGADTSLKDARGFDVMIEGARGSREDIIDVLRRSGAKTGISIMLQASLLCKATYEGKLDRLELLLKAGCNPDAHDYDGQTALHVAAAEGSLAAARVLLEAGATLTIKDRWGYTALDVAHKVGAAPLVELLTAQVPPDVAAVSAEGWRRERTEAALAAARYGDTAALTRLLNRGCPVDASDYDGRSLLHVAVHNKQEAVVKQLLAAGADPNVRSSNGSSPLLEAAMAVSPTIQSDLMSAGARLGMPATEEAALLSSVLHAGRHDQLLALLTAGADPAAADYDSRTPLHIAASLGDVGALQLMADALADSGIQRLTRVNWQALDRWGDTPLQEAQRAGHQDAAAFLQRQIDNQHQQQQQGAAALAAGHSSSADG